MLRTNVPPAINTDPIARKSWGPSATFLTSTEDDLDENNCSGRNRKASSPVLISARTRTSFIGGGHARKSASAGPKIETRNHSGRLKSPLDKFWNVFKRVNQPNASLPPGRFLRIQDANGNRRTIAVEGIQTADALMEKIYEKFGIIPMKKAEMEDDVPASDTDLRVTLIGAGDKKMRILTAAQLLRYCQFDAQLSQRTFVLQIVTEEQLQEASIGRDSMFWSAPGSPKQQQQQQTAMSWSTRPLPDTIAQNLEFFFPSMNDLERQTTLHSLSRQNSYDSDRKEKRSSAHQLSWNLWKTNDTKRTSVFSYISARLSVMNDAQESEVSPIEFRKGLENWIQGDMIGRGSFARVYFGINPASGQIMAVKQVEIGIVDRDAARRARMLLALQKEVEVLSRLDHPNVVKFYGSGYDYYQTHFNLFLEYLSGGTLESLLRRTGQLDIAESRAYTRQILDGLAYLHDGGIVHRDIKSANLLITSDNIMKISDFGVCTLIASLNGQEGNPRVSMQGSIFWMAPESIRRDQISTALDIWAVGCVLLEMLTGKRPWSGFDSMQACYQIGSQLCTPLDVVDGLKKSSEDTGCDSSLHIPDCAREFLMATFQLSPSHRPSAYQLQSFRFVCIN